MALLKTKLHVPETGTMLVKRSRLLKTLDDSLGIRLTLISAPAGFGKTTLVASWLARQRCAWVTSPLPQRKEDALSLLLNDLNTPRERFALVLDDLYMVVSKEIYESLSTTSPPPSR